MLFSSCARKPGKDIDMSFVLGASFGSAGGAMLYGKNLSNGEEFGETVTVQAPFEKFLSFGQWKFWVVAWPGDPSTGSDLTGLARCDFKVADIQSTGGAPEVVFNLSNAGCDSNEFAPHRLNFTGGTGTKSYNMFPLFDIRTCMNLADSNSFTEVCSFADGELGPFLSFRVLLEKHENGIPLGIAYESACMNANIPAPFEDQSILSQVNIPLGSPDFPVRTVIRAYYGSVDCDMTNDGFGGASGPALGFKEIIFPRGVHQPAPGTKVFNSTTMTYCPVDYGLSTDDALCSGNNTICEGDNIDGVLSSSPCSGLATGATGVSLDAGIFNNHMRYRVVTEANVNDICQGFRLSGTFAAGNGVQKPYMICTPTQFNNISDTYLSSNFYLMADLNMNLADQSQINNNCGFWPVTNTIPVGGLASDPGTCASMYTGAGVLPFTGLFHGRGHWMMNTRIENDDLIKFGLFRFVQTPGTVKSLNFSDLEVRGKSNLGGVVGNLNNTMISDITIYGLDVGGGISGTNSKTGGVVGSAAGSQIFNVHVYDAEVEASGNQIGGIIGVGGASLSDVSFEGNVELDNYDNSADPTDVGGLAGAIANTGQIIKGASKGSINAAARNVGGIIGNLGTSVSVSHVYSTMNINNEKYVEGTGNALNTGGIAGSFTGNTIEFAIFSGAIQDKCNYVPVTGCKIGNLIGNNAGTTVSQVLNSFPAISKGGYDEVVTDYNTGLRSQSAIALNIGNFNADTGAGCNLDQCWYHTDKDLPRLSFEDHDCYDPINLLDIFSQVSTLGRGSSESNPIYICTQEQLKAIGNTTQSLTWHYILKDHLLVGDFTADRIGTDLNQFTGTFNGNEKVLYGLSLNINTPPLNAKGMFNYLGPGASVKNMRLHGVDIFDDTSSPLGAIVGENNGVLFNSFIRSGKIISGKQDGSTGSGTRVGALVGKNNATVELSGGGLEISARNIVGGIVGENSATGLITDSISYSFIQPHWNGYGTFGGAIGTNYGTSQRITVHSKLDMRTYEPSSITTIGGIVGKNMTGGKLIDSYSESNQMYISYPDNTSISTSQRIGPIYGQNSGQLKRIVSTVDVQLDATTFGQCLDLSGFDGPSCSSVGGSWNGINCEVTIFNDEASCIAGSKAWQPHNGTYMSFPDIRGTTDVTNGIYHMVDPYIPLHQETTSSCTVNGSWLELPILSNPSYDVNSGNPKYVFLGRFEAKGTLVSMVAGPKVRINASQFGGDCTMINNMISNNGGNIEVKIVEILNQDINSAKSMSYMTEFNNFCSSATGLPDNTNYVCTGANDFDIVTDFDHPRDMGFNRLLNKFVSIMNEDMSVLSQGPYWQMEGGKPPRLVNFD